MSFFRRAPLSGFVALFALFSVLTATGVGCESSRQKSGSAKDGVEKKEEVAQAQEAESDDAGQTKLPDLSPGDFEFSFVDSDFDKLVVDVGRQIRPAPEPLGDKSQITIEPEVAGTWKVKEKGRLVFESDRYFTPDTEYTVALEQLEVKRRTSGGDLQSDVIRPRASSDAKTHRFQFRLPPFEFRQLSIEEIDKEAESVTVGLEFSGPVDTDDLSPWANFSVGPKPFEPEAPAAGGSADDKSIEKVKYLREESTDDFKAVLEGLDLEWDEPWFLKFELDEGVPFKNGIEAPGAEVERRLQFGPEVEIDRVFVAEGTDSHYLYVVCDDNSVKDKQNFYNLHESYDVYENSVRCTPEFDSAKASINISPEVDFSIAPTTAGFQITGDFERKEYTVEIQPGLQTLDGGTVREAFATNLEVGPLSGKIHFVSKGRYVPPAAWDKLPYRHRNLTHVNVRVREIPPENIAFWLSGESHDIDARTSNILADERMPASGPSDEFADSKLDLKELTGKHPKGVYEIQIEGLEQKTESTEEGKDKTRYEIIDEDVARLAATDMNLIAKRSEKGPDEPFGTQVSVWALDMQTNEPIRNAEVKLVRPSGRKMATCSTNAAGYCRLEIQKIGVDKTEPMALIASKQDDVTFLEYSDLKTEVGSADIGGESYKAEKPYRVAMYGQRDLYRPNETIGIAGIVRTGDLEPVDVGLPVKLVLTDARGNIAEQTVVKTNEAGAFEFDYDLLEMASTGKWNLEAAIGEKRAGTYAFFVEEFVPERMKVDVTPNAKHATPSETLSVHVDAQYLFGAPAEGSNVEVECSSSPENYSPDGYESYHFGFADFEKDSNEFQKIQFAGDEGKIDADGKATVQCGSRNITGGVSHRVNANVSVLEAGSGRSTDESVEMWAHPASYGIGLKANTDEVEKGESFEVQGVVVDWAGKNITDIDNVELEFISLDRQYNWRRRRGNYESSTSWQEVVVGKKEVSVENGMFRTKFEPERVRDAFAIRAKTPMATTTLQLDADRYNYYYWRHRAETEKTPGPQTPTSVPIESSEPAVIGKSTAVQFQAPFRGKALLTLETDEVLAQEWKDVEPGKNTWEFELDEFAPNAYVSAFIVKDPHLEAKKAFIPRRAFGTASIPVEPVDKRGNIDITVPDEVKPGSTLDVRVEADTGDGPTYYTVAAVDEGILQLNDYESPAPLEDLLVKKALGIETFDTVGWNVHTPGIGDPSGGGGSGDLMASRRQQSSRAQTKVVDNVAFWSGLEKMEGGSATESFELPQYRGELRVMAVALGRKQIASDETRLKVTEPLTVQTTTPRFMSPGDRASIPVFLTNQSDADKKVEVTVHSEPVEIPGLEVPGESGKVLSIRGAKMKTVDIPAGESKRLLYKIRAEGASGRARLRIRAAAQGLESRDEQVIALQSAEPKERRVESIEVGSGTHDLSQYLEGWEPTSERTRFWLTNVRFGPALMDKLSYLANYPHGCIEQTVSSTRPLLYLADIAGHIGGEEGEKLEDLDEKIEKGINRIRAMQTAEGAFAYWPGRDKPHHWGTAFATDMLIDARKQGYKVPARVIDAAVDWMADEVGDSSNEYAHPYMHYVLARMGEADVATIRQTLKDKDNDKHVSQQEAEKLYLLKAALYKAGDWQYSQELKKLNPTNLGQLTDDERESGGGFYSTLRNFGWRLTLKINLFGQDAVSVPTLETLARKIKAQKHLNTQEAMWAVTALGKWTSVQREKSAALKSAHLRVGGDKISPTKSPDSGGKSWAVAHAADRENVQLDLELEEGKNWNLIIASEGVRKSPTVEYGGNNLDIERKYVDKDGNSLAPSEISVGDLFFVKLTVENKSKADIQNVAVIDRIPGGLEIENPRLSGDSDIPERLASSASYNKHRGEWWYEHLTVRDDRLKVFGDLGRNSSRDVVYGVRATVGGTFAQPPVRAEAMYVPSAWARQKGETVRIRTPW